MVSRETRIGQLFVRLADSLTEDFDEVELMHQLADACLELLEVAMAGLVLVDLGGRPRLVASAPDRMQDLGLFELQADEGPCLDVLKTGREVVNVDLAQAQQRWPQFTPAALQAGIRFTHALPLKLRGNLIGAMNLFTRNEQHLSDADLALGQALADLATIGLLQHLVTPEPAMPAEELQSVLDSRARIQQAKAILAEHSGLEAGDTFPYLQAHARHTEEPLQVVVRRVIAGQLSSIDLLPAAATRRPQLTG